MVEAREGEGSDSLGEGVLLFTFPFHAPTENSGAALCELPLLIGRRYGSLVESVSETNHR